MKDRKQCLTRHIKKGAFLACSYVNIMQILGNSIMKQVMYHICPILTHLSKRVNNKLEDLKVLRRSPDLLNNVKIGQG